MKKMEPNCTSSSRWCSFEVLKDAAEAQVEACVFCHRKVIYNKVGGRIDNVAYLRDHVRDFCQPTGSTRQVYEEIYGHIHVKRRERMFRDKQRHLDRIKQLDQGKSDYLRNVAKAREIFV